MGLFQSKEEDNKVSQSSSTTPFRKISVAEVGRHSTPDDAWIIIDNLVYDITKFHPDHPGGANIILSVAGRDATAEFEEASHSAAAYDLMKDFVIGEVDREEKKESPSSRPTLLILYGSQKGTAKGFAEQLGSLHEVTSLCETKVMGMEKFDPEDLNSQQYVVFLTSTYENGTPPTNAKFMMSWLSEAVQDFRVGKEWLAKTKFAVYGLGDSLYEENFNLCAKQLNKLIKDLDGVPICAPGFSDFSISREKRGTGEEDFEKWLTKTFVPAFTSLLGPLKTTKGPATAAIAKVDEDQYEYDDEDIPIPSQETQTKEEGEAEEDGKGDEGGEKVLDVEDLGAMVSKSEKPEKVKKTKLEKKLEKKRENALRGPKPKKSDKKERKERAEKQKAKEEEKKQKEEKKKREEEDEAEDEEEEKEGKKDEKPRPMLTPTLEKNLTKQGYKIIGSHSGVKICRWTKAMLRGRGGCYKHTFYGIQSYQCMEMTPSLACANKCVFCWRHHTNPVGKEWRWEMNEPEMILDKALENHRAMIKQMKGVPGVQPERLREAQIVRHCALSLVGEPIMYPEINKYVRLLHEKGISSFLVTNAQFPDRIEQMHPVTQLYVSIDAATQDSLKKIDRPLFKDFWDRYIQSLKTIKNKKGRTVYRLTLVKGFNTEEVAAYARLIGLGLPSFIEIKGVTFCGASSASDLTMKNVPFHEEVRTFSLELCKYLEGEYEVSCEHVHSCCILISHKKFKVNGKWHTWIDYDKFNKLMCEWYETGKEFDALDYMDETPEWAIFGKPEGGFDPAEKRWYRNKKKEGADEGGEGTDATSETPADD